VSSLDSLVATKDTRLPLFTQKSVYYLEGPQARFVQSLKTSNDEDKDRDV
jgi:hypothetical protein